MVNNRAAKVAQALQDVPDQEVYGDATATCWSCSWGGTLALSVRRSSTARDRRTNVSHAHVRWLNPMPKNLATVLRRYKQVLVCELNMGQLELCSGPGIWSDSRPLQDAGPAVHGARDRGQGRRALRTPR